MPGGARPSLLFFRKGLLMASLNRDDHIQIYIRAKSIFKISKSKGIRQHARRIAMAMENVVGQLGTQPAETWKV